MASPTDRIIALKNFDDTKTGVKGLLESGITSLPAIFHHPRAHLSIPTATGNLSIPTVDLSLPRSIAVDLIRSASREWGVFQVINHGIPLSTIQATISAVRSFHELSAAERSQYYSRSDDAGVRYYSNLDLFLSAAATWKGTLRVAFSPVRPEVDQIPEVCRAALVTWDECAKEVAREVMQMMCEGLGVDPRRLEEMTCLEGRTTMAHYYPPCPEPDRALGAVDHTDAGLLAFMIQDQIGGLQVKSEKDECWVDVKPSPGSLVVFIGDFLQIISNNEYKSGEHRVKANFSDEPRISVVSFYNPGRRDVSDHYGPLPELLSDEKPACYRNLNMVELFEVFRNGPIGNNVILEHYKLTQNDYINGY